MTGAELEAVRTLPEWIVAVKEIGIPGTVLAALFYLVVYHVIPMVRDLALERAKGELAFRQQLLQLIETQRADHRDQVQAITKTLDRLCALIVAHDMRSGGGARDLIQKAEMISGEKMPEYTGAAR